MKKQLIITTSATAAAVSAVLCVKHVKKRHRYKDFERLLFYFQDADHSFSIDLTTILECVQSAAFVGMLPMLPKDWCEAVENDFHVLFCNGCMDGKRTTQSEKARRLNLIPCDFETLPYDPEFVCMACRYPVKILGTAKLISPEKAIRWHSRIFLDRENTLWYDAKKEIEAGELLEAWKNRARGFGMDQRSCGNCDERLIFHFEDPQTDDIPIPMTVLVACFLFAAKTGVLPALPDEWKLNADGACIDLCRFLKEI